MASALADRVQLDFIRYANCWEDADVLCAALAPAPGKRILSVASGGDNSLALAAEGAEVVAADLNPAQLAGVELKMAAFRRLSHEGMLSFLGVRPGEDRAGVYAGLRGDLSPAAAAFWDARPEALTGGFFHHGKFERYFRTFRTRILPLIHGRRTVAELMREKDEPARRSFYESTWNNLRWRCLFRVFFSRFAMGRLGRDPELFRYVEGSVADRILARARYALTVLPTHANPYLDYLTSGTYGRALPRALRPEKFGLVQAGLDRVSLFLGPVEQAARAHPGGGFDGFNLSDVFEYLDPDACAALYGDLLAHARPGARLAYWNMLVPRRAPAAHASRVKSLEEQARALFARDLAFFYSAFVLEEVRA